MSEPVEEKINPVQIVYLAYQLRQAEIQRNDAKKANQKEALTMHIRKLKAQLDPMLMAFAEQEKKKQPAKDQLVVDRNLENKDLGPPDVIKALHAYAQMKLVQEEVLSGLKDGPVSVAGEYNGAVYVVHFQLEKS